MQGQIHNQSGWRIGWLLVIPTIAWFYIGLFLVMTLWYPTGLPVESWRAHLLHFSVIYVLWLAVFFSYRLFDWENLYEGHSYLGRLFASLTAALILAVVYFYFQPSLLITPRRFLLVHVLISGVGIAFWYALIRRAAARSPRRPVYVHSSVPDAESLQLILEHHSNRGLKFATTIGDFENEKIVDNSLIVVPTRSQISHESAIRLFSLRGRGIVFIEHTELYEKLTRAVSLTSLSELWFVHSIDYGRKSFYDLAKRVIDITFGLLGIVIFVITFPIISLLIKISSSGPVFFKQRRVGINNSEFLLYKYRTMRAGGTSDTWTEKNDLRITSVGKILRRLRLDELPQVWNILKGEMSIVGPRPEQVNIVTQLQQQIPYYNERHIVKPGLTGWAQLHVYAGTVEETKKKLQYDLYYIKHRSLQFDLEIILKTVYNLITFSGR